MTINFGRCVMRLDEGDLIERRAGRGAELQTEDRPAIAQFSYKMESPTARLRPAMPKIAAFAIAGAVNWICQWYEPAGSLPAEEIATAICADPDAGPGADTETGAGATARKESLQ